MKELTSQMPAWALSLLPVRLARQYANKEGASETIRTHTSARQLLVDVSVIHQNDVRTGIQRVVRALMLQLLMMPPAGYHVRPIFATRQHGYRYAEPGFLDVVLQTPTTGELPVQVKSGDLFLGLDLAAHLLPRHRTQVLQWKRSGVKVHVVVYDLLPLQHSEWFNPKTVRNFERWVRWLAVYADSAICISETVKNALHAWLSTHFRIQHHALPASTIMLGADIDASAPSGGLPADASFVLSCLRCAPAVLMVGTLEPRKGYDQALAAFEELWRQGNASLLVIVGRPGWKTESLQAKLRCHPQAGRRLFWLEDVSDEYLTQLYAACSGVLLASRAEGFGLPLIEAACYNKPVLARDLLVFREIGLSNVTYFSDQNSKSLAAAILVWLQKAQHESYISQVRGQDAFTWRSASMQLLNSLGLKTKQNLEDIS